VQGAPLAADQVGPDGAQQSCHRLIVGPDQRREAADALGAGTLRQVSHQFGAEPPPLPAVDDGDRDLGRLRVVGVADVAAIPTPRPSA
jgi:hypothetical protein